MKTITLEIQNEQDLETILAFIQQFNVRVIKTEPLQSERKDAIKNALAFWQEKSIPFQSFTFNREEANER